MKWLRRGFSTLGRILNTKLFDTPRWFIYLPFATNAFLATIFLGVAIVGAWSAWRIWTIGNKLMVQAGATRADPNAQWLFWLPLTYFAMSLAGMIVGIFAFRAALREWRKLRTVRGFEVLTSRHQP